MGHLQVPQNTVGRILGKMGATINEIQDASNCDIKMNQDTKESGFSYCICTSLKNSQVDLDTAERLIKEKIAGSAPKPPGMVGSAPILLRP